MTVTAENFDLHYTITIKGIIPCSTEAEQKDCLEAGPMMDTSLPDWRTRTDVEVLLTGSQKNAYLQTSKSFIP